MRPSHIVILAAAVAALAAACGDDSTEPTTFDSDHVSSQLVQASVDLTGHRPNGEKDLRAAVDRLTDAVADTSHLGLEDYQRRWGHSPSDEAALAGRWLALGINELQGADDALLRRTRDQVNVALPNEPADNPLLSNAQTLRATFQSSYAATAS